MSTTASSSHSPESLSTTYFTETMEGDLSRLGDAWNEMQIFVGRHVVSSSPSEQVTHVQITKKSDFLYELEPTVEDPQIDIVFFHGIRIGDDTHAAHTATWMSQSDPPEFWPKAWLGEKFPRARIFTVSYDSSSTKGGQRGRWDFHSLCEGLFHDIIGLNGIGQRLPVMLVGHCLGGLVIKQFCVYLVEKKFKLREDLRAVDNFIKNLQGVFFFATPQLGMNFRVNTSSPNTSSLWKHLEILNKYTARLNEDFQTFRQRFDWDAQGAFETHETFPSQLQNIFQDLMVSEASAIPYLDKVYPANADHFNICQPKDRQSSIFQFFADFTHRLILKVRKPRVFDPSHIVGLEDDVKDVVKRLRSEQCVALVGMGGAGKSTLAKVLFNQLISEFEYSCFISVVKDRVKGIQNEELIKEKIEKCMWEFMHHNGMMMEGVSCNWGVLEGKRLLMVLDDIESNQLRILGEALRRSCSPKSRFIITSRNQSILTSLHSAMVPISDPYLVRGLNPDKSRELLLHHSFPNITMPKSGLNKYIEAILEKCDGLPLALEVMGKHLKKKSNKAESEQITFWDQSLKRLETGEPLGGNVAEESLWRILRLSVDELPDKLKEMFLDAATFFFGQELGYAMATWSTCYEGQDLDWEDLVERSLVTTTTGYERQDLDWDDLVDQSGVTTTRGREDDKFKLIINVHEQLRTVAGMMIRGAVGTGKRVLHGEGGLKLLESPNAWVGLEEIVGVRLQGEITGRDLVLPLWYRWLKCLDFCLCRIDFQELDRVHHMDDVFSTIQGRYLSRLKKLKYLDLQSLKIESGGDRLPTSIVFLKLDARNIRRLPFTPSARLKHLAVLVISQGDELEDLPESFGELKSLKVFVINRASYVMDLARSCWRLPESFGELAKLEYLRFHGCSYLQKLPESFGKLSSLKKVAFIWCHWLETVGESFGNLSSLQELEFQECGRLESLPESFGNLSSLQELKFWDCGRLDSLPKSFGDLSSLQELEFRECGSLKFLPDSFGNLSSLQSLTFRGCGSLDFFYDSFDNLSSLQSLTFRGCGSLDFLPESFSNLSSLQSLTFKECRNLLGLPLSFGNLSSLQSLRVYECDCLDILPDSIYNLPSLQYVTLRGDNDLQDWDPLFTSVSHRLKSLQARCLDTL